MADIALLGASVVLTIGLPIRASNLKKQVTTSLEDMASSTSSFSTSTSVSIALGFSLVLFSLSILEILPSSWRVLLENERQQQHDHYDETTTMSDWRWLTISTIYRFVLWGLCIMVMVVLPAAIGIRLMDHSTSTSRNNNSNSSHTNIGSSSSHSSNNNNRADPDDASQKKYPRCGTPWKLSSKSTWWYLCLWKTIRIVMKVVHVVLFMPCCFLWRRVRRHKKTEPILVMTVKDEEIRRLTSDTTNTISTVLHVVASFLLKGALYRKSYILGSCIGVATCFLILSTLGPHVIDSHPLEDDGNNSSPYITHPHPLATLVSWLCAIGLLLSSLLNGFGSVSMPHSYLVGLYLEPIRPEVVAKAEEDLAKTTALLDDKTLELANMAITAASGPSIPTGAATTTTKTRRLGQPPPPQTSATANAATRKAKKSFSDYGGEEYIHRRKLLQEELDFLEMVCEEQEEDVMDMKRAQALAIEARTCAGRVRSYVGMVFSMLLVIRLAAAAWSIVQNSYSYPLLLTQTITPPTSPTASASSSQQDDPITSCLLWLMGHDFVSQDDYNVLSQCISLLFTAILSVSQIRTFLRTVAAMNRRIHHVVTKCDCQRSRQQRLRQQQLRRRLRTTTNGFRETAIAAGEDNNDYNIWLLLPFGTQQPTGNTIYTHILAILMGCYFLSCLVLLKLSLPLAYRTNLSVALWGGGGGKMEYYFRIHSSVINAVYAMSAIVSGTVLAILFGIQKQSSHSLTTTWMMNDNSSTSSCGNSKNNNSNNNHSSNAQQV